MRLIRSLISLAVLGLLIYLGATVNLGTRTFFGHIANIWRSDEAQELRKDVGETAGPMLDKAKRGAKAGWDEYKHGDSPDGRDAGAAGAGSDGDAGNAGAAPVADADAAPGAQ